MTIMYIIGVTTLVLVALFTFANRQLIVQVISSELQDLFARLIPNGLLRSLVVVGTLVGLGIVTITVLSNMLTS